MERLWGHVFTSTLTLTQPDTWPRKLFQAITQHQSQPIWMAQNKVRPNTLPSDNNIINDHTNRLRQHQHRIPAVNRDSRPCPVVPSDRRQHLTTADHRAFASTAATFQHNRHHDSRATAHNNPHLPHVLNTRHISGLVDNKPQSISNIPAAETQQCPLQKHNCGYCKFYSELNDLGQLLSATRRDTSR